MSDKDTRPTRELSNAEKYPALAPSVIAVFDTYEKYIDRLKSERNALLDENANLKRDKERLDWLAAQVDIDKQRANNGCFTQTIQVFNNASLREAIDAAMESTASEGKEGEPK